MMQNKSELVERSGLLRKGNNGNSPQKGARIVVEPIREKRHIKAIARMLGDKPRDYALFVLGISTALRASDLLNITAGQVRGQTEIALREIKTGKDKRVTLNNDVQTALARWLEVSALTDDDYLFTGQRGRLTVSTLNRLVKSWCRAVGLRGNYGSHTLRKTFGYHQRVTFGADVPTLMTIFNHSSQRQTLAYLGIQPSEIADVYSRSLL